ncbi:MAG TPA: (Fe-S)-binding protein [Candidatus Acidoferrales bacterium]|nr:(Fe-S)-binding protein [Candidatus Acidoferrales bacterium]
MAEIFDRRAVSRAFAHPQGTAALAATMRQTSAASDVARAQVPWCELRALEASLALLRSVKGLDYVELPRSEECCGFGGLFSVKYPELSVSMGEAKREAVIASQADVLASGDASCLMHIEGLFRKRDPHGSTKFMHLAEILASDG